MLTARGIKPICTFRQEYKNQYLFGSFSPINGNHFLYEMSCCDGAYFQLFLDEFSKYKPEEYKIVVLDNGAFHKSKNLNLPENIALLFLPPYSPELNPAEKMWQFFKRKFMNLNFKTLKEISSFFDKAISEINEDLVKNICAYEYVFSGIDWTVL